MDLTVYTQYYRCKTADRQSEIDECLRRNLNHPGIRKLVLFKESDAPPLPQPTVELEVVESDQRITHAEWLRWVQRQGSGIALLLNADIYLDKGLEHLPATFDSPETFLALTRYNPGHAGFHLNDYPHWTQDVWGVRADAKLPESLLYASSFPLGFPGCDNRIAYVMWSHGFRVRNPCYHVCSVHLQASTARAYDKTSDRLYGGVSYVHPSLAPDEDAELEFTLWTRSQQRPAGVLVNQQAIEQSVHQLRYSEAEMAPRFFAQQQFTKPNREYEAFSPARPIHDTSLDTKRNNPTQPRSASHIYNIACVKKHSFLKKPRSFDTQAAHMPINAFYKCRWHSEGHSALSRQSESKAADTRNQGFAPKDLTPPLNRKPRQWNSPSAIKRQLPAGKRDND